MAESKVVTATGVSVNTEHGDAINQALERAMADAILACAAEGVTGDDAIRARMRAAYDETLARLTEPETAPGGGDLAAQNQGLQLLQQLPVMDAIGVACSFLLHCSYNHRQAFRRVMNEKVVREGFGGVSLLKIFMRASQ